MHGERMSAYLETLSTNTVGVRQHRASDDAITAQILGELPPSNNSLERTREK